MSMEVARDCRRGQGRGGAPRVGPRGHLARWASLRGDREGKMPGNQSQSLTPEPRTLNQVSLDENHAGRKVEEQLLELLDARIQVAGDDEKRQSLEKLWQSLRQATRAARQQARACERTEEVLSECVDPDMRSRIMDAHQEATLRTQEAMRVCLRETMVSLEAEYRLKEERDSKAGLERDTAVADKIAEKLVEARAALEEQEERFKKQERQREESVAPQRASSIEAAPQGHDESLASSAGVREPQRSASSGAEERKSATWQQFLKRQEAAAARNQAKRAASIEPGKTPGAESVGPLSRGASESLGHASEGDRDNDGDGGRGREMGGSNDKEKGGRGTKVSQKSKQKERQGTESESERGRTKADAIASPDSSLA